MSGAVATPVAHDDVHYDASTGEGLIRHPSGAVNTFAAWEAHLGLQRGTIARRYTGGIRDLGTLLVGPRTRDEKPIRRVVVSDTGVHGTYGTDWFKPTAPKKQEDPKICGMRGCVCFDATGRPVKIYHNGQQGSLTQWAMAYRIQFATVYRRAIAGETEFARLLSKTRLETEPAKRKRKSL